MPDDGSQQGQQTGGVFIPPALRESHGDLIELILRSESMNDEERQYWIDILPVMTPDQIEQLRVILVNERNQLAEIDAKYAEDLSQAPAELKPIEEIGSERRERASKRTAQEIEAETAEAQAEEEILKQVQDL